MDREKFKAMVHFICWSCRDTPHRLGAVKLNKTLWVADFAHYRQTGAPISGQRYVRRKFGPVPSAIMSTLRDLESVNILQIKDVPYHGYLQKHYMVLAEPDTSMFSELELQILRKVITLVCDEHTAQSISDLSHDHVWQAAGDGEEIPYYTIFSRPESVTDKDRAWAERQLQISKS